MSDAAERLYERVLVLRCQTGDAAALSELIRRYAPRLRFYLRKMTSEAAADDLLQDVWIDVFAKVARLRDPGAFTAWLYRIARDAVCRELRRRRVPILPVGDQLIDESSEPNHDGDWSVEDVERVRAELDALSPAHREVLLLQFVEGMSYEQIAGATGCAVGTVRSRIHYAKRSLRALMERDMVRKEERS